MRNFLCRLSRCRCRRTSRSRNRRVAEYRCNCWRYRRAAQRWWRRLSSSPRRRRTVRCMRRAAPPCRRRTSLFGSSRALCRSRGWQKVRASRTAFETGSAKGWMCHSRVELRSLAQADRVIGAEARAWSRRGGEGWVVIAGSAAARRRSPPHTPRRRSAAPPPAESRRHYAAFEPTHTRSDFLSKPPALLSRSATAQSAPRSASRNVSLFLRRP